jgi:hypothetical protein
MAGWKVHMVEFGRAFGTFLVVGFIGPAFWLGVNVLEGWLQRKGFPLAGFDLFSLSSWRRLKPLLHRGASWARGKATAQQRLLK